MNPSDVIRDLPGQLDALGLQYMIGGSFASSVWGHPRQTNDIDIVVDLPASAVDNLIERFAPDFLVSRQEIVSALTSTADYRGFQLLHYEPIFKVDVFLLADRPFDLSAFARRIPMAITENVKAPCLSPEDTVLRKLLWYELGKRISDRQWNDIVGVIEACRPFSIWLTCGGGRPSSVSPSC